MKSSWNFGAMDMSNQRIEGEKIRYVGRRISSEIFVECKPAFL